MEKDNQSGYSFEKQGKCGAYGDKNILVHEYPCLRIR